MKEKGIKQTFDDIKDGYSKTAVDKRKIASCRAETDDSVDAC
jgi:hypothetical protein